MGEKYPYINKNMCMGPLCPLWKSGLAGFCHSIGNPRENTCISNVM